MELGQIGEDIYFVLYSNGTLLFRGTGATYDYDTGRSPFWENTDIKKLVISDGITAIGSSVFENCSRLAEISLPTSLESIGERAFFMKSGPEGLEQILIPSSFYEIGTEAFVGNNVSEITLPESLKNLGEYLFMECFNLNKVRVECEKIPALCFVRCSSLSELTLSRNVKKLGDHMINYTPLTEINYEGSLEEWGNVKKGTNWDNHTGANNPHGLDKVICLDGYMEYDRDKKEWKKVKINA